MAVDGTRVTAAPDGGGGAAAKPADPLALAERDLRRRRLSAALDGFRKALKQDPGSHRARLGLATAYLRSGEPDAAIVHCRKLLSTAPEVDGAWVLLGASLAQTGDNDGALAAYGRGLAVAPRNAELHLGRALALLRRGDWAEGFREYEWRWRAAAFRDQRRGFSQPLWDGGPLAGRHILLHCEQGYGDSIQFARWVPEVARQAGRVTLECPVALQRLFAVSFPEVAVVARGEALPAFDVHCPLLSLPLRFAARADSVPAPGGYLTGAANTSFARRRGLAVGVLWQGNPEHPSDRRRSLPLAALQPLLAVQGVDFWSLQREPRAVPPDAPAWSAALRPTAAQQRDFAALAAIVARLDLVVTVDSAVAHLAGALGRPVWVLLPAVGDWRWGQRGVATPWYAAARLFRQSRLGDWGPPVAAVAAALAALPGRRAQRPVSG
ncbi:MAG: tetratricopeptide repeat protein [Alphaproteobacteria bacterium]